MGTTASLLAGNLDLIDAVLKFSKRGIGVGLGEQLKRAISKSKTKTNAAAEILYLVNMLQQHKVIDTIDDPRSNVPFGTMDLIDLIGYRPKMKLTVVR